jgi:superfamily I DNA and RNA helicase
VSKEQKADLVKFLKAFSDDRKSIALKLRDFVWDLYPRTNELIYDNFNALAFGWSTTDKVGDTFCTIALYRTNKNNHFGFYWGSEIKDPNKILIGNGKQYRYILVDNFDDFPKTYIKRLLREAYANSMAKLKDEQAIVNGQTIVKSISANKRATFKRPTKKTTKKSRS